MGIFDKFRQGLSKTRESLQEQVNNVFGVFVKIDEEFFEELEDALILSDMGVETTDFIISKLKEVTKKKHLSDSLDIKEELKNIISEILTTNEVCMSVDKKPAVILVIGVNGVGKTTSIAKLAHFYKQKGNSVLLAAADTFRAAAIEQLDIWAKRCNCDIIKQAENADPAAVVFDACKAAKARNIDILICDTAGRLHNKKNLMDELNKISRVIERELPDSSKEILLVLDASTGQNALNQAKLFGEASDISGIILTKLDGTAKGGIVVPISKEQNIPVKFVGIGEGLEDLHEFNPLEFADALFN